VSPGQRDRDAVAGDGHADHDPGQVVTVVLGLAERPEPGQLPPFPVPVPVPVPAAGDENAVLVRPGRLILAISLEVRGGGVEEQEADLGPAVPIP
jgi:hypothetical protein